uniref:PAP21-like protein n=1 Tax=Caligus clemensi TaxID=344056 RepID=C1C0W8_CALCM|nr:PAP21-like protein precursor [Caligus clemensi]
MTGFLWAHLLLFAGGYNLIVAQEAYSSALVDSDYKYSIGEGFIFMEILQPSELQYTYKLSPSTYTPPWNTSYSGVQMTVTYPLYGCGSYVNDLRGKIALVQRGECSFFSKGIKAQEAGALGIIVSDNKFDNDDNYYNMADDYTGRKVNIPMAFLIGKSGFKIRNTMAKLELEESLIRIPVNISNIAIEKLNLPPWLVW